MPDARKPGQKYEDGDLRAALLEATETLVGKHGPNAVSLREVARTAGVSHGAPAHHFGDKRGLFAAFASDGWARMGATILEELGRRSPENAAAMLAAIGDAYIDFALRNPGRFDVMFRRDLFDLENPAYVAEGDAAWSLLDETIQRAVEEGRAEAAEADDLAFMAWSMVHGFAALWNSGRVASRKEKLDPRALAKRMNAMFVREMMAKKKGRSG